MTAPTTTTRTTTDSSTGTTTVLVAGATGMLGSRIAASLLEQPEVSVRLLVRAGSASDPAKSGTLDGLVASGATLVEGDVTDPATLDAGLDGVHVVVSALQGGAVVIVDGQVALAEAAVRAGVSRFLPSDFAIDLFALEPGAPQFDIRRRGGELIDALPLEVVHVLNGAFMDMMLDPATAGIVDLTTGTATLFGTGEELFQLTTVEDTARFTARVATDPADLAGKRYVSGATTSFGAIIAETEQITGTTLTRRVLGSADDLRRTIAAAADPWSVVREHYLLAMLTAPPFPRSDDERYPDLHPTGLREYLVAAHDATSVR